MFYRIEIQRENGRKRVQPLVLHGQFTTYVRAFGTRSMVFMKIDNAVSMVHSPHLYNPTLTKAAHEGLLFSGLELTPDGGWVSQSWWCAYTTVEAVREAVGTGEQRR